MLSSEQILTIKEAQSEAIHKKSLTANQLKLAYDNNWFNLWVPKEYGGKEAKLGDGLALLEALAYEDGGFAWTVTLCSGANMFAGFLEPGLAQELFNKKDICWGGSGRASGTANWDGEHYVLRGEWQYATGAPHLTHFTLNARLFEHGQAVYDKNGEPKVSSFFVPRDQVLVHYDWTSFGLECTASHSFSLQDVGVPKSHAFSLGPQAKTSQSPLFELPFMPFAELTLVVNYIGMFRRFLDLVERYFFEKAKDTEWAKQYSKDRFKLLDGFQVDFEQRRGHVFKLAEQIWSNILSDAVEANTMIYEELSVEARSFVADMRQQVVQLFPLLGILASQMENELNIVFRNIFTASQHSLLNGR
ncbi:acyl-CoA dehydrogenase [Sphingobacterium sp. DK4209]|uniref:Acyl-CoA dehydrogenase n=1 Tax=Sphingobacterium zhuxiongii TaxID=2662364 RepID=A0A5Q0QA62_9SPHI|nr:MULTISPECIES: acyl-CoA dehydrogenase [unclassified Sphingobacterium]MVZ65091.1 acyl-CoA dehydrogenase [Sphingobacterium sp. DK4209]QGA26039.1 acyl-CoA dehydrogenase [Sphingobacterium sp. dk4302]